MLDRLLCGDGERRGRSCHFPTFHPGKRMNIFNQTVHINNNKERERECHFIDLSSRFRALWTFTLCVTFVDIHEDKFNRQTHFVFIISSIIMVEVVFSNVPIYSIWTYFVSMLSKNSLIIVIYTNIVDVHVSPNRGEIFFLN